MNAAKMNVPQIVSEIRFRAQKLAEAADTIEELLAGGFQLPTLADVAEDPTPGAYADAPPRQPAPRPAQRKGRTPPPRPAARAAAPPRAATQPAIPQGRNTAVQTQAIVREVMGMVGKNTPVLVPTIINYLAGKGMPHDADTVDAAIQTVRAQLEADGL